MIPLGKEPFEWATRNTVEVVTEDDLRRVLERLNTPRGYDRKIFPHEQTEPSQKPQAYVGFEP
ncbi:MAG TPA: hypothetical protein VLU98_02970, partial [Methanomicrobiales archaeon]|nr:hypothetical protein [Methanomicrobiales archaeon]